MQIHRRARRSCIAALPLNGRNSGFGESRCDWEEAATGVSPCILHELPSNKQMSLTGRCLFRLAQVIKNIRCLEPTIGSENVPRSVRRLQPKGRTDPSDVHICCEDFVVILAEGHQKLKAASV